MTAVIGYWGWGEWESLDSRLSQIGEAEFASRPSQRLSLQPAQPDFPLLAAASVIVGSFVPDLCSVTATDDALHFRLSASGLAHDADAQIEIQPQGLRLTRDPFGRLPLYWARVADAIWFASEARLLLPLLSPPEVSLAALYGYLCFSYMPTPLTPVENLQAVPAGKRLGWQLLYAHNQPSPAMPTLTSVHEWQEAEEQVRSEPMAIAALQALLDEAIADQLGDAAREPVGVLLSGGLDSSLVAACLVRAGVRVRAYALDFGGYGLSELPFAEQVAGHLRIPLTKVSASPRRIQQAIAATARALDVPYGDGVTVPLYLLGEAASQECAVIFNGEGGDQLFAGWTNKPLIAAGVYQQHASADSDFVRHYLRTFHRLHGYEAQVFRPEVCRQIATLDITEWLAEALQGEKTPSLLHRLRRANLLLKGASNIQPRASRLAHAHRLKVRTPFCYKPLAKWTFTLAPELLLHGACEKYLLKRAVESLLPAEIVWREKRGMGVPLTEWALGALWREVGAWLQPNVLMAENRFQPDLALRIALGRLSGQARGRRIGELLWLLLMWQVWRKTVLKEEVKPSLYNPFWMPPRLWQWRLRRRESE